MESPSAYRELLQEVQHTVDEHTRPPRQLRWLVQASSFVLRTTSEQSRAGRLSCGWKCEIFE